MTGQYLAGTLQSPVQERLVDFTKSLHNLVPQRMCVTCRFPRMISGDVRLLLDSYTWFIGHRDVRKNVKNRSLFDLDVVC